MLDLRSFTGGKYTALKVGGLVVSTVLYYAVFMTLFTQSFPATFPEESGGTGQKKPSPILLIFWYQKKSSFFGAAFVTGRDKYRDGSEADQIPIHQEMVIRS
jgi:hypothetical protein